MKNLTIRNLPPEVALALEREKRRRSGSLNQTVNELLQQGLGVGTARFNGLANLAGSWTDEEFRRLVDAVAPFEAVDTESWK